MTDTLDTLLRWTAGVLEPCARPSRAPLLVADSWLVDEGRQRAAALHWARFERSCLAAGASAEELRGFRAAAEAALPRAGRWFPRVQLTSEGLALRTRPAPALQREARVLAGPPGDPRRRPRRKGPDLELLAGLRATARERGADELLLRARDGTLLEGALSSLLWWEGDALCTTPSEHTLPGVTRALLLEIARARGVELRVRAPQPEELAGAEVWLTSALHGIRVVSAWVAPALDAGAGTRAAHWREELERDA
ncbi:MAG TPA: aminotransferase class IV [Solirubrobacteraceae bacterium]|nr:aminotransferase class IV [Solirubrobacteraceae bacterium]